MVYNKTEKGIETPTIACVDGMPYSSDHFFCSLNTGGEGGLGQQTMSFIP